MSDKAINELAWSDAEALAEAGDALGGQLDIYAHRGSTLLAPENTELAFARALGFGADVLEIDVRLSADGHVMVTHDAKVDRTCDGRGAVADLGLQTLKAMDAGWHFRDLHGEAYRGRGIRLLTLDELFVLFPGTRINIDIKDAHREAALAVAKSIADANAQRRVNVGSFHAQAMAHFRQAMPEVTTTATQGEVAGLYFGRSLIKSVHYQFLQIPLNYYGLPLATPAFLQQAKRVKVQAVYWTVNDIATMKKLALRGVNGLVTDRVDLACDLFGKSRD